MNDAARFRLFLILFAIMLVSSAIFMYFQHSAIRSAMEGSGETIPDAEKAREESREIEASWKAALTALAARDIDTCREHLGKVTPFEWVVRQHEKAEFRPGLTFGKWWNQQLAAFRKAVLAEFQIVIRESLAQPATSHRFVDFFLAFKDQVPELLKLYEERKAEILAARMKSAGKWFRLSVSGNGEAFRRPAEEVLKRLWKPVFGRELFPGPSMSEGETTSTWMHLEVVTKVTGASYELKSRHGNRMLQVQVPVLLSVSFKLQKRLPVPTSWDNLKVLSIAESTPPSISGQEYEIYDLVNEQARKNTELLEAKLRQGLEQLPPFQLFPGIDPTSVTLFESGAVNPQGALVLGLTDPGRLEKEVRALAASASGQVLEDLISIAIEQDLDSLGPWVTEQLAKGTHEAVPSGRRVTLTKLLARPGFADFGPLIFYAGSAAENDRLQIFEVLGNFLFHEQVQQAFIRALGRKGSGSRSRIAAIYLQQIPESLLRKSFSMARDSDPEVARLAFETINRRLPDAGAELAIALFPSSTREQKQSLLWNLKQKHEKLPAASVGILRQAAGDSDSGIREQALEILCDQAYLSPEAWQALNAVKGSVTDPSWKERIGRQLADAVSKSNPAMARQFIFAAIRGPSADDRRAAAHKVFRLGIPAEELLPEVVSLVTTYGSDGKFFEAVLRSLSEQGLPKMKNVDSADLEQILKKAVDHSDKMVKYFGYTMMYSAWSKGAKKFAEPLKFGLTRESDAWLKGQIKSRVEAINRAENPGQEATEDD